MKLTKYWVCLLILAVFLGFGCNKKQVQAPSSQSHNPCDLVDKADIDALFDSESIITQNDIVPQNVTGQKLCVYSVPSDDAVTMVTIGIQESKDMVGGMTAEELFRSLRQVLDNVIDVENVGSAAYQSKMDTVGGGAFYVLAGQNNILLTVDVSLGKLDHEANQVAERELADKILQKL